MSIYFDQVIEAAYLHSRPRCFFIGPYARRVSFTSQQYRALDLVAALKSKKKLERSPKGPKLIAVVGAGIAGLTAAVALRGAGCRVHLYERHPEPLQAQANATHRVVHPTISRWPQEELSLTTNLAFFDWYCAPANQVVATLRREWEERLKPKPDDPDFRFFPGTTVTLLNCDETGVFLRTLASPTGVPPNFGNAHYDYSIITTGFGDEEAPHGLDAIGYWNPSDEIDVWRKEQRVAFVSGCGDGGLMDCLRLIHEDFDRGWLTIRIAERLEGFCKDEIVAAEEEALMADKSLACMPQPSSSDEKGSRLPGSKYGDEKVVGPLTKFYDKLVEELPESVTDILDVSMQASADKTAQVTLLSKQRWAFGPKSAPIHKIMVAYAMKQGLVTYEDAELASVKGKPVVRRSGARIPIKIDPKNHALAIRHGSPANLGALIEPPEIESLRIRQFLLADYLLNKDELDRRLQPPGDYPLREDRTMSQFIASRLSMVRELMQSLRPGCTVTATRDGFVWEPRHAPGPDSGVGVLPPRTVFGISLIDAPVIEAAAF